MQLDGSVVETLRERNEARLGIFISMPDIKKPQLIEVRKLRFFQVSRWARLPAAVWERSPVFLPRIYSSRGGKKTGLKRAVEIEPSFKEENDISCKMSLPVV